VNSIQYNITLINNKMSEKILKKIFFFFNLKSTILCIISLKIFFFFHLIKNSEKYMVS